MIKDEKLARVVAPISYWHQLATNQTTLTVVSQRTKIVLQRKIIQVKVQGCTP